MAVKVLRDGGNFCAKFFKSSDLSYLDQMMKQLFRDVYVIKPQSSRVSSAEAFVVCLGFKEGATLNVSESLAAL
jgi:tRNA (cytidine32/guanosine34-2'-O)-methyltransferase